ncbi:MAG: class I SAM-dependent methyltransferase [Candidatus Sericytochromatia bacterium]|nr:class I SAM-dependent methyltransferase [Candidatus Sericytochromatia bacterium]
MSERPWRCHAACFEADQLNPMLAVSPWAGHRAFVYDWVVWMRPRTLVELGSHYGCSLFTFAQAAKDHRLDLAITAVDTWAGDAHTGPYDASVFALVERTRQAHFADLSLQLRRESFAAARAGVPPGSVDLLHLDGCHDYAATRADDEAWRDALAPDGVILFHDVAPDCGYGSARYWAELRAQHPHLEFLQHSYGLGLLFPKGDRRLRDFIQTGAADWLEYYRHQAEAALLGRQVQDQAHQLEARWGIMQRMEAMIQDRDAAIASQARLLEERWGVMQRMEAMIQDRDGAIASQARLLEERWAIMQQLEALIQERDAALAARRLGPSPGGHA